MKESQNIKNLAIDPFEQKMYFIKGVVVTRANFDGSGKEIIRTSGVRVFALDSVERRMYWVNAYGNWIYKGNMNFTVGKDAILYVFTNNLAIDPYSRLVTHFLKTHTLPETCMGQKLIACKFSTIV